MRVGKQVTMWVNESDVIIIIKFFNKKVVKRNFTNGEQNGVHIIVNNNVYTKLLSRNVRSFRSLVLWYENFVVISIT